ncbi:MAG: hypothetical protein AAFY76_26060, partial [Cyanobacteria bacterium J06649_11]
LWIDGVLVNDTENLELATIDENGTVKPLPTTGELILTSDFQKEANTIDLLLDYQGYRCIYYEFNRNHFLRRIDFYIDTKPFADGREFRRKWWKKINHLYYFELTENISREKLNQLARDGIMYSIMESKVFVWYR